MVKCTIASTEMERTAILQQRHDIFVEEFNFFTPREDGQRIEYDKYDDHALLLGVWENDTLIASCRLLFPNSTLALPTLKSMKIDSEKFQRESPTAEISRITVSKGHRAFKKTTKVLQSMQKEINRISANHGIVQLIGAVEPSFLRLLNCSGLPYIPIGPLQYLIGADRYPVMLCSLEYTTPIKECL